jgi:hypothetical protein
MRKLVGIAGKAHSGKDTFAQVFISGGYHRVGFADALKQVVALIANEDPELYFDAQTKEEFTPALGMTRRAALQGVGQGIRNSLGPDTWVMRVLNDWERKEHPALVITDVRYPNEAGAIRARGGVIVRISRPGAGLDGESAAHASEVPLPEGLVDIEIINDGTIGELHHEARKIVQYLSGREE